MLSAVRSGLTSIAAGVEDSGVPVERLPAPRQTAASSRLALQILYYAAGNLVGATLHARPESVMVGPGKTDFALSWDQIGGRQRFQLARPLDGRFGFCFDATMKGVLHRNGEILPLSVLKSRLKPSAEGIYEHPLGPDDIVWLELGGIRAGLSYIPFKPRELPLGRFIWPGALAVAAIAALGFMAVAPSRGLADLQPLLEEAPLSQAFAPSSQEGPAETKLRLEANVIDPLTINRDGKPIMLPTSNGARDLGRFAKEALLQVIRGHYAEVQACFQSPGTADSASVKVGFLLSDLGHVTSAWAMRSEGVTETANDCLVERFRTWRFPKMSPGQTIMVSVPLRKAGAAHDLRLSESQ
jgi:hypothetical protein